MTFFIWGVLPYIVLLILISGLTWRYKYDQFGWTTRSSQLYESKILKIASPIFHFALLAVFVGHIVGLLVPKSFTDSIGLTQDMYHAGAYYGGGLAGIALAVSLGMLIWRRRRTGRVFKATTANDKIMYLVLAVVIVLGLLATFWGETHPNGDHHNYRETVSVWFRSMVFFQPDVAPMAAATWQFKAHVFFGLFLFAITPFTRLVHAFTAPVHYLFRPYIVYRSRDQVKSTQVSAGGRGWDPVGTPDRDKGRR